ncbi:histidine kinase [Megasphaera sp. ASD88]|jgi:two-component system phosphate regulon sensor histidine kinase PhoR|uniref:sensor histidine kinase n=1 Tax=Megasphaera TaxID=906 RepID=UPI0008222D00|nr:MULTISPECIES: ATP-binding protein [Megasphaera]MDN0046623.1 ATP-binding protein [Megasphaera hexanoica]SCI98058.1 Alkaline phosphatase synthesis sensor protein phoR [uncultured Ruminococcus sp.]MCU6714350.1 ATP-binding protein [Megasphaera butyrica]OUO48828.1 histidine kinase [Megasphaera sp. An286]PAV39563.1 histidine kinase [Megasphaera sp. ASD88]
MRKKIYVSLLAMGFACMAITVLISGWFFWQAVQRQAAEEMHVVMNVISNTIQKNDDMEAYLQGIADGCEGSLRITWINPDGTIRFESKYDKWQMENHLDRPEVQEALNEAYGTAVRKSHTLSRDLYYMAEQMPDGTILRLSMERESIYSHFLSLLPVVALLLLCAAVACIKASRMLTASLLNPLRRTVLLMRQIGDPNGISVPASYHVDAELRPLVDKIIDQSQALNQLIHSLEQQRNIVRLMMENLQEGVILTDDTYRILGMNRCAGDILQKKDVSSLVGQPLEPFFAEAPWDEIHGHTNLPDVLERKISRDASLYLLTVQSVYQDEEFYGVLFIIDDITEQEHREQLRREFTSNVSHELKTPLTSISGFAEVLSAGLFKSDADVVHFGSLIRKEAKRLLAMIEEIMHLTRIEENREKVHREPVCLPEIIRDIVEFMEPMLVEKKVTVHCTLEQATVLGDKGLLREMAMNLIDNAVKYNLPGGHVYVSVRKRGDHIDFAVKDTGIGIPEDKQKRVFERFYRADTSRSRKISGSGLGLSIVKHIAEYHNGTITLRSKENHGTEIIIHLPSGNS